MEVAAREVRIILTIAIELGAATANTYGIDMRSSIYYINIIQYSQKFVNVICEWPLMVELKSYCYGR